jgi:two-component system nitrate/nitrite response regulator NarL
MVDGESTATIARRLGIGRETVRSHVRNMLPKLGVHSRLEAVAMARRQGLGPTGSPSGGRSAFG